MKKNLILICAVALMSMTSFHKKIKIVFFGDSITMLGINKGGYINKIQDTINAKGLQNKYELIGAGVSANKVYDLYLRIDDDVIAKKPNIVVVYVGINDVWHKTFGTGTDIEKYEKFYEAIIKKLQAQKAKLILCTPSVIGEKKNNANAQDADLNAYADVVRKLAEKYSCDLVDLHKIFTDYENEYNINDVEKGILTVDKVHLTDKGNRLVADEIIKKLNL